MRWLRPPPTLDPYSGFSVSVLHYTLLVLLALDVVAFIFATSPTQRVFLPILFALLVVCLFLLHTGRQATSAAILIGGFWLLIMAASLTNNGILNASFPSFVLLILLSAVFFTNRVVVAITLLSCAWGVLLVIGEQGGVLPLRTTQLFLLDRLLQSVAVFVVGGIVIGTASRVVQTSHDQARASEAALRERNQALESEIAERQRVEASLRLSEERYRLLFENMSQMCGVFDRNGQIILINENGARMVGSTPAALHGQSLSAFYPDRWVALLRSQIEGVLQTGASEIDEYELPAPDGTPHIFLRQIIPLSSADSGRPDTGEVFILTTDVTEQRQATAREQALALAQEKSAFLMDFLGTISHDLKTPLSVIKTTLYLLERETEPVRRRERLEQLDAQTTHIERYIQDMLMISRLEHLPMGERELLDVAAQIGAAVRRLLPRADKKQISLSVALDPELPPLLCDPDQLERVLLNLLENAINYTPAGGSVRIEAVQRVGEIEITLSDTGIGIAPDELPHIFERFYRGSGARQVEGGTGLGLAIVRRIVDLHQGSIDVLSTPGAGTTFRLRLPLTPVVTA